MSSYAVNGRSKMTIHPLDHMIETFRAQKRYFSHGSKEIARDNLSTMRLVGAVGTVVALTFFCIAPVIIPSWHLTKEYLFVLPVLIMAFVFSLFYSRSREISPVVVTTASVVFYLLLMAVFIAISVFPYPDTPQIYISLCIMFMPVLLTIRPSLLLSIMVVDEIVFISLAVNFKTKTSIENDIFNTVASLFFAVIIMYMTNRLRCRNYDSLMELQRLSETDSLTGLLNKNAFEKYCGEYLTSRGDTDNSCTFMMLDLDDFKQVNDRHGHPFGDLLLAEVGKILKYSFDGDAIIGRIGGDEFAILLRGVYEASAVTEKCNSLEKCFNIITVNGMPFRSSCSIGAVPGVKGTEYSALFALADEELYRVKRMRKAASKTI